MVTCTSCGSGNRDAARFCFQCGQALRAALPASPRPVLPEPVVCPDCRNSWRTVETVCRVCGSRGPFQSIQKPEPIQWQPDPGAGFLSSAFRAYCVHDRRETVWLHRGAARCTCKQCGQTWETGSVAWRLRAFCMNCGVEAVWVISPDLVVCMCLGCGSAIAAPGIEGVVMTKCSRCQHTTPQLVFYLSAAAKDMGVVSTLCLHCGHRYADQVVFTAVAGDPGGPCPIPDR